MEKSYETYAKKALMLKHTHKQEAGKIRDTISQIDLNQRLSDFGKQEAIEKLKGEAGNLNKQFSDSIRGLIRQFCKEFGTSFAEDYADHSTDVANALKIIEMCGSELTAELLHSIIEPLKGSHKAMKMIYDVLTVKYSNIPDVVGVPRYSPEIERILNERMGTTAEINEYLDRLKELEAVADCPLLSNYEIVNMGYNGMTRFEVQDHTIYSVLALPDTMMEIGKQYEALALKYPQMFTNYIPTNEEIILDGLND